MHEYDNISKPETTESQHVEKEIEEAILNYNLDIKSHFHLPISFLSDKKELKENIIQDLELIKSADLSNNSVYENVFCPKTIAGRYVMNEMPKLYTSNKEYLKGTQNLLKTYKKLNDEENKYSESLESVIKLWKEIKGDPSFKSKYHYIEWTRWAYLNNYEWVLQFLSMYSLASPVITLLIPFVICIIPFFILVARGITLTWQEYMKILKIVAKQHALVRIFTDWNSVTAESRVYLILSSAFYIFSFYQNFLSCLRFYKNMQKMHQELLNIRVYIDNTIKSMENFLQHSPNSNPYTLFNNQVEENKKKLIDYKKRLENIQGDSLSLRNVTQIGKLMKHFYDMHDNDDVASMFLYTFGFHGFLENLHGIQYHIQTHKLGFAEYNSEKKSIMKDAYYGSHINKSKVSNDIKLDKSIIITGPNASGKTTTLKTTLINVILSQQIGCGFYSSAILQPYDFIHCYLNIPDTSGRDSLFQAEARRCKEIIDIIQDHENKRHFCVFDELYSGTNPDEAVLSASAFMKYLTKSKLVDCILTTHFIEVCKSLDKQKNICNYHMLTSKKGEKFEYKYILKKGISKVKGGVQVLSDMNYPDEIIKNTIKKKKSNTSSDPK